MERWGTSYMLHETVPVKLVGGLGATVGEAGRGTIRISIGTDSNLVSVRCGTVVSELELKWELALQLLALLHVLALHIRLLRSETPVLQNRIGEQPVFAASGGIRTGFVCTWKTEAAGARCERSSDLGSPGQVELILDEDAALQLISTLAECMARSGIFRKDGPDLGALLQEAISFYRSQVWDA